MRKNIEEIRTQALGLTCISLLCLVLLLPGMALAYGGGGGGGGGGNAGFSGAKAGNTGPSIEPMLGIEGLPIMPPEGYNHFGGPYHSGGTYDPGPQSTPKSWGLIDKIISDQIKDKFIETVTAMHPGLGLSLNAADKVFSAYEYSKKAVAKLRQAKKDYQKAALGNLGSGLKAPKVNMVEMGPSLSGGGGPALLHDNNMLW